MSWNRTVRCSNCYTTGHNISGCPDHKAQYEREKKANPDSYWVKNYEAKLARRKNRACSYCKEVKHTRRTCKYIKADKEKTVSMNKEWRSRTLEHLKRAGFGIGALVQLTTKNNWSESRVENVMISAVFWRNLTFQINRVRGGQVVNNYDTAFAVRPVADFARTGHAFFPMDVDGHLTQQFGARAVAGATYATVLSPVSETSIEASVPEGWLTGEGPEIDQMFTNHDGKPRERYYIDWVEK